MEPFLDFYCKNKISPVRQDISDLLKHFDRRGALYRQLGIVPSFLSGKSVLEFGPGTGQNAIFTASLEPARFLLVDGNPTGLEETRMAMASCTTQATNCDVVGSDIMGFSSDERFDLVLCEGVIPFQLDPGAFARHVGQFCRPGGLLVITTIDGISFLGEAIRRLIADVIVPFSYPTSGRLEQLRPIFSPHLATLSGMSRFVDDWIYDNILVPYSGRLFSVKDGVEALSNSFDIYGSSPDFLTDWRWYKQIYAEDRQFNERAIEQYLKNVLNFIDYREDIPSQDEQIGLLVLERAESLFYLMCEIEGSCHLTRIPEAAALLTEIADIVDPLSPNSAKALYEAADFIRSPEGKDPINDFEQLNSFFGRGQQYLSFIRHT